MINITKVNSNKILILSKEKGYSYTKMGIMKGTGLMAKDKDREDIFGLKVIERVIYMTVTG